MHLTQGQITFTICFFLVFVVALAWAYRKDKVVNRQYFKGVALRLFLIIIAFFSIIFLIIKLLHKK